jgi:hypothetical protein
MWYATHHSLTAGFKRMPAVVGMAIFLQYWCEPPSAVTPKAAHARLQHLKQAQAACCAFSASLSLHTYGC